MHRAVVAFVAGACAVHAAAAPPPAAALVLITAFALAARRRAPSCAAAAAGFVLAAVAAAATLADRLDERDAGARTVTGVVASIPDVDPDGVRFAFRPDPALHPDLPRIVRAGWYLERPPPTAGERWRLTLRLRPPRGSLNPAGFDYERWLAVHRIGATASVQPFPLPARLEPARPRPLLDARAAIDRALARAMPDEPRRGLVRGLVLGERSELGRGEWEVFARTGTAHLMAISGLHIGLVAALAFGVAATIARRLPWLAPRSREVGVCCALAAALAYAALAGFAVPTRRAVVMVAAASAATVARRHQPASTPWFAALAVVTALDPLAPLAIGFWLSFAAVAAIAFRVVGRRAAPPAVTQLVRVQWAVALGLLPLTLWFFQRGSVVAPLVNLVAVPAFTLVVVPASLIGAALAVAAPAAAAAWLAALSVSLDVAWAALESIAAWPWAQRFTPQPPLWSVAAALVGAACAMTPRGLPGRRVAAAALTLPMLAWRPEPPPSGGFTATVLDVGQGLSAVVRTRGHTLLYDAGPRYGTDADAGERVVLPYLRAHGVSRVDTLVVSHAHADHDGGVASVRAGLAVERTLAGDPDALAPPVRACRAGESWRWDGVAFRVLHPVARVPGAANLNSCVLEVRATGGALLLPGDVEWPAELELASPTGPLAAVDVVVAPHHGSRTSSTGRFVQRTAPRWTVVPASFGNRWSFPHDDVVARWTEAGAEVLVTGASGAVTVRVDPASGVEEPERERARRRAWWRVPE